MSAVAYSSRERKLSVPFVLLMLTMVALLVSLMGLARTSALASERMNQLQVAWEAVQDGSVEGSELVVTDRLMDRLRMPVPAMRNAAYWSLGLTMLSMLMFAWLIASNRRADELHAIAGAVADNRREQSEQAALLKLLDEMAPLASGDLRVRATVGDTMTGALADGFNYTISELRWLVGVLDHTAGQINDAIERSLSTAETVTRACTEQSGEILRSSNQLLSMSGSLSEVTTDATDASLTAQKTVEQAERGMKALSVSFNRLAAIRNEADVATRLMRRLAENVAAIDDRVQVIRDIAGRTDLLALNTTIKAAASTRATSPSDAAGDMERLSDEVTQLAEVLGQATRDIFTLTRTISQDAADTVQAMNYTSVELAASVAQTQKASDAFQMIRQVFESIQQRVAAIADKSAQQTGIVRKLSENMDFINHITRQTGDAVSANADSMSELAELSSELKQSLSDFRLPAKPVRSHASMESGSGPEKASLARKAAGRAAIHG